MGSVEILKNLILGLVKRNIEIFFFPKYYITDWESGACVDLGVNVVVLGFLFH